VSATSVCVVCCAVVVGKGFITVNITFPNTAGYSKQQVVAVRNGANMSTFYNCSFEGYQDIRRIPVAILQKM